MIKTIQENWLKVFKTELFDTDTVCIVSPFITDGVVKHLLDSFNGNTIKVITRYNLNEFRKGVSSLTAIERLLKANAQIKSVKDLHCKLYLFDSTSVIITSANFTNGGFFNNKEFGVLSKESNTLNESHNYFDYLWRIDSDLLNQERIIKWRDIIDKSKPKPKIVEELPDFGVSYKKSIIGSRRYFIKFFGKADNRYSLDTSVISTLEGGCSHFALSFSKPKNNSRPKRYRSGDIVFLAMMTENPNDYAIYGKAEAIAHDIDRDVANEEDIQNIPWLKEWPILVRLKNPVFINSKFRSCPKLNDLINDLDYDSFAKTKERYDNGERNIIPKKSLMRKSDVILSDSAALWMELAFQKAILNEGEVDISFVKKLYQGRKL